MSLTIAAGSFIAPDAGAWIEICALPGAPLLLFLWGWRAKTPS